MKGYKRLLAAGLALAFAVTPTAAYAAGTGDDPNPGKYTPTKESVEAELEYQRWLATRTPAASKSAQRVIPEAAYQYFYTPTRQQETSYWCGPATCQIIDDYWGVCETQAQIAKRLGTTTAGTDFTRVPGVLTALTGRSYVLSPAMWTRGDVLSRIQFGLLNRAQPAAADVRIIGTIWNNYVYDHAGHIIPIEAFDWRVMTIRINDPYNEATRLGGGYTLGHKTYPVAQIQDGILRHPQKVLAY